MPRLRRARPGSRRPGAPGIVPQQLTVVRMRDLEVVTHQGMRRSGFHAAASAQCTYGVDWVATKLRWKLTADDKERAAPEKLAADCSDHVVKYEVAP